MRLGESLEQACEQSRYRHYRGNEDVLLVGVKPVAGESRTVEGRDTECASEIAVAPSADCSMTRRKADLLSEGGCLVIEGEPGRWSAQTRGLLAPRLPRAGRRH